MDCLKIKKKIKREKPNKKWTEEDIKIILNYLQEAPEIEAPTAQMFYKKLIETTAIDASWDLLRWKVRHFKASFKKANDWRKSTGAGLLESDAGTSSVEGKCLQMCPHYMQLSEILTSPEHVSSDPNTVQSAPSNLQNKMTSPEQVPGDPGTTQSALSVISKKAKDFAENLKKFAPKSSSAYLAAFQTERTTMFKMKFQLEREKHQNEHMLNERKIKLEEEKAKAEIDLKKQELDLKRLEIEKDEKLRTLEIERDERLKKYEIEMMQKKT